MSAHARRIVAVCDTLVAHPLYLPWFLASPQSPKETRTLLGAVTAVVAALCEDREARGWPMPLDGLEGLIETALEAWAVEADEHDRIEAAYGVTLMELVRTS